MGDRAGASDSGSGGASGSGGSGAAAPQQAPLPGPTQCFGPDVARRLLERASQSVEEALPNEPELLLELRARLGPHCSEARLAQALRAHKRLHWSVNSYLRGALSSPRAGEGEDFEPKRPSTASAAGVAPAAAAAAAAAAARPTGAPAAAAAAALSAAGGAADAPGAPPAQGRGGDEAAEAAPPPPSLAAALPGPLLEDVLRRLGSARSVCRAACACRALNRAAAADGVWRPLFLAEWDGAVFPTRAAGGAPTFGDDGPAAGACAASGGGGGGGGDGGGGGGGGRPEGPSAMPAPAAAARPGPAPAGMGPGVAGEEGLAAGGPPTPPPQPPPHPQPQLQLPAPRPRPPRDPRAAAAAAAGGWRALHRRQRGYEGRRACPRCGEGRVVPILYGYPTPELLAGMRSGRLVLGGDHLIESAHIWACRGGAGCCFRSWPWRGVRRWEEDERRGRGGAGAAAAAAAAAAAQQQQQQQEQQQQQQGQQQQQEGQDPQAWQRAPVLPYTFEL
ncbi:hypothetical protein Rsub_00042 [Raphidocelis subcapitata]|uniref:F-box domain-containing protein n=1 Tax=Raphidocelis subcapitata TaxID=307507 RepID=A0A2V0NJE9_9CHLO|nr:hypothetical protein Rsub_00042 [Raphidocelis subcapitata]|eukprot:GBF87331.1 hypothetical protein Rsub_00042 [Raphidocelis subcapitata]